MHKVTCSSLNHYNALTAVHNAVEWLRCRAIVIRASLCLLHLTLAASHFSSSVRDLLACNEHFTGLYLHMAVCQCYMCLVQSNEARSVQT